MNANREGQRQELGIAVENSKKIVADQQIEAGQEEAEVREIKQELREAELTAQTQKETEEKGQESERRIHEVSGA